MISSLFAGDGNIIFSVKAEESKRPVVVDLTSREDFGWGINTHHYSYESYPESKLEEQIHLVAKSGATWIRMNGAICSSQEDWAYFDTAVGLANKYGLKIIMTVEPNKDFGLDYITLAMEVIATRYNGKEGRGFVDYFQPWNETDIPLMKAKYGDGGPSGESIDHYYTIPVDGVADLPEYLEYFKAAKQGLINAGNKSKMMINFAATHWGCVAYYLEQGLEIDMIGMDLYTVNPYDLEMSAEVINGACDRLYEDVVKKYNVPVFIAETNLHMGMVTKEDCEKAELSTYDALIDMLYIYYGRDWIKGLALYELLDEPSKEEGDHYQEAWFGLIKCSKNGEIGEPKPIYSEFQRLIKGNNLLPMINRDTIDLKPYEKLTVGTADDSNIGKDENTDTSSDITSSEDDYFSSDITSSENSNVNSEVTSSTPTNNSSNVTSSKPTNNSSNVTSSKPTNNSSNVTSSKPTNSSSNVTSSKPTNITSDLTSSEPSNSSSHTTGDISIDSSNDFTSSEESLDDFNTVTDALSNNNLVVEDTVSQQVITEEVIIENITYPVKNLTIQETTKKVPWGLGVGIGLGMLIIPAAYIIIFILINKKKNK